MPERSGSGPFDRFVDWLAKGVASVAESINKELVERGWFGREVTPGTAHITPKSAGEKSLAEQSGWDVPGRGGERAADTGWFARHFSPDADRAAERDPAERRETQERGIER